MERNSSRLQNTHLHSSLSVDTEPSVDIFSEQQNLSF